MPFIQASPVRGKEFMEGWGEPDSMEGKQVKKLLVNIFENVYKIGESATSGSTFRFHAK